VNSVRGFGAVAKAAEQMNSETSATVSTLRMILLSTAPEGSENEVDETDQKRSPRIPESDVEGQPEVHLGTTTVPSSLWLIPPRDGSTAPSTALIVRMVAFAG
jgi:hypothetical protein